MTEKSVLCGFYGSDGYSIIVQHQNLQIIYGHLSPDFLLTKNIKVKQNQLIANVGPKYIGKIEDPRFVDSNGKPLNGATTGSHLHITIKKDGIAVNPLDYL